jgi:CRP-like cAMP-binding protein
MPAGKVVCREGVLGHQAFVIVSGEVSVTVAGKEVARLGPGNLCGEMALLEGGIRSATVTAVTPVDVLALSVSDFNEMLRVAPTVNRRMLVSLSARLREADRNNA